jgi:hypothetical protein
MPMYTEEHLQNKRRERLRLWLSTRGGPRAVCVDRGLAKSTETRISNVLHGESFGSRGSRALEAKLGMSPGYLDGADEAPTAGVAASGMSAQATDLGQLLDMLPNLIARSEAYSECSKIIIELLRTAKSP